MLNMRTPNPRYAIEQLEAQVNLESRNLEKESLKALDTIDSVCIKFHRVARQLAKRYKNRQNFEINDKCDVQYLLHVMLGLFLTIFGKKKQRQATQANLLELTFSWS